MSNAHFRLLMHLAHIGDGETILWMGLVVTLDVLDINV